MSSLHTSKHTRRKFPRGEGLRAMRATRRLRQKVASESRGSLRRETRMSGSDGTPVGGAEREGAAEEKTAATPPSESRTEVQGVAQPAPSPAVRRFGTFDGSGPPRADGAGRMLERGFWRGGRRTAQRARSARRGRRPLVIVPYLKKAVRYTVELQSRPDAKELDEVTRRRCRARVERSDFSLTNVPRKVGH